MELGMAEEEDAREVTEVTKGLTGDDEVTLPIGADEEDGGETAEVAAGEEEEDEAWTAAEEGAEVAGKADVTELL